MPWRTFLAGLAIAWAMGAVGYQVIKEAMTPAVRVSHQIFNIQDPFERCLAAVEAAELPGWVWECRQTPDQEVPATRPDMWSPDIVS